jgi:hypothetical protein
MCQKNMLNNLLSISNKIRTPLIVHGLQWRYAKSYPISKKETLEEMDIRTGGVTQDLVLIVTVTGTQMVSASTGAARMASATTEMEALMDLDTTTEMDMAALKTEEDLAVEVVEERVLTSIAYLSEDLILAPMTIT